MRQFLPASLLIALAMALYAAPLASAIDDAHARQAQASIDRGIAYLRSTQGEDGSWSPKVGPAITALAITSMLDQPDIDASDPTVKKAIDYILSKVGEDGSISDGFLKNYNTAICLSALSRVRDRPDVAKAVAGAQAFLKGLQWNGQTDPKGNKVDENHPYYGGAGYGDSKHGRPDMSNTQIMLEALYDSGLSCEDPAFQRALVFVSRNQGHSSNKMFADKIENDGGFIYSTSINRDLIGVPESKANPEMMDEAKAGKPVSGLRTYGSMTYAGFKSYIYADLPRDDPRVVAALDWIKDHYTLDVNPGLPESQAQQGLFYYYATFAKALDAWGATTIAVAGEPMAIVTAPKDMPMADVVAAMDKLRAEGVANISIQTGETFAIERKAAGQERDWANDLIAKVASLQKEDGSWVNEADRWMEGDPNLATSFALIALSSALP